MHKVLAEALKLPVDERATMAEKLLESVDAEGQVDDADADQAWAEELERRARELRDGTVRGLSPDEARQIVASDSVDE